MAQPAAETPETDPEILALLGFEPVPRSRVVQGAWTPELQRAFIARLAVTGSPGRASEEMGKTDSGVRKLYRSPGGASFRAAWHAAVELAKRRRAAGAMEETVAPGSRPPSLDHRRKASPACPQCGRAHSSAEEEAAAAFDREGEEARQRIMNRIDRLRRKELMEMRGDAAKRQAYELLNGPVDWDNIRIYSIFSK